MSSATSAKSATPSSGASSHFHTFHTSGGRCIEIAPEVICLQQSIVNLCFIGDENVGDRGWVLVDAGLPGSSGQIRRTAADLFGQHSRPAALILTHGHFDHVGDLPALAEEWDCPVYAHELEMPYLTGLSSYPPPDPAVGGGAMSLLSPLYPCGPINLGHRVRALPLDGTIPFLTGWRWVHTPGHSPGHISLFRALDRVLIAGDAFVTTKQESALSALLQMDPHVHRPPAYFTPNWEDAHRSVRGLAHVRPDIAITGHGRPIRGEALQRGLQELADNWEALARPSNGRYIDRPAVTNERGVVSVPPPVTDWNLVALAGLGAGVAAGALWLRSPVGQRFLSQVCQDISQQWSELAKDGVHARSDSPTGDGET